MGASIELNNILIPSMIKNNINGKIIHISSYSAIDGRSRCKKFGGSTLMYAKVFLNMYIKALSKEFKKKISFTGILPGPILLSINIGLNLKRKSRSFKKISKKLHEK